ncbi:hypothetical protein [Leptospira idonii]|uniref:Svf1-like C-terminal domain-containing protein n=1 Tax=Leptospira idonii TaxID=1193500 RepID=A0A4R9M2D0_9LEPT|nr:hypothetical protein [Leptospira idonii]TGN18928.1 hypothetical protein EHS15_10945 [Leptospira idonii]
MKRMSKLRNFLLFLVLSVSLHSEPGKPARLNSPGDFRTQIHSEEGYLQAWNFSLRSTHYKLFGTFLVSNFGPGSKNNGISVLIKYKDEPIYYSTKEFDSNEFGMKKGQFFQQSGENWMDFKDGKYSIHMVYPEWTIDLEITPNKGGVAISGGKFPLNEEGRFVQADIPVSFGKAKAVINHNGVIEEVEGTGGMEHMLTNYEVYKFSRKWEIARALTKDGYRIFTGGFIGTDSFPGGNYRKVAVLSPSGSLIFEGTVEREEILSEEEEPISGYILPKKEKLYFQGESCYIEVNKTKTIAAISALENISTVLKFFIQLFFAKPYQIHSEVDMEINCPVWSGKGKGIHSNYLINK